MSGDPQRKLGALGLDQSRKVTSCRLCGGNDELVKSHIIPEFVFRWLKKTGSKYGRNPLEPNKRIQDGLKPKLLCMACEQRFGKLETYFSKKHFHPIVNSLDSNGQTAFDAFEYTDQLYQFVLSIMWRRLVTGSFFGRDSASGRLIRETEQLCREKLLEGRSSGMELHMAVLGACPGLSPERFFSTYMARSPDGCTAEDEGGTLVYTFAKMGPFLFFMPHQTMRRDWLRGGGISEDGRVYDPSRLVVGSEVFGFLVHRARDGRTIVNRDISPKQRQAMRNSMWKSLREDPFSQHSQVVMSDLGSSPRLLEGEKRPGRNERCFCGSGKKYKWCCWSRATT